MRMKKEYVILAVILVALVLYIALKNTDRTHYTLPELKPVDNDDISKVLISSGDSTIKLSRVSGEWKIMPAGYEADSKKVEQILDELSGLTITTLVSEAETYQRYGLTPEERVYARAFDGDNAVRQFYIGKTASTMRHSYIKFPGDPRVYEARNNIKRIFDKSVDDLRDKTVLTFEGTAVSAIALYPAGEEEISLEKKAVPLPVEPETEGEGEESGSRQMETTWTAADGRTAKSESIKSLIRALSNLKCSGYVEGRSKEDFEDPVFTVIVTASQQTHSVSLFEKDDQNRYPAVSSGSDYPFYLSEWKAKQIMKGEEELIEEEQIE